MELFLIHTLVTFCWIFTTELSHSSSLAMKPTADHYGKHFVFGFTGLSGKGGYITLSIIAKFDTNVKITYFSTEYKAFISETTSAKAGSVKVYSLQKSLRMADQDRTKEKKGIEVNSTYDIAIVCLNNDLVATAGDGYLALPTQVLGTVYVVATYKPKAEFGIISGDDGTTVNITFTTAQESHIHSSSGYLSIVHVSTENRSNLSLTLKKLETFHVAGSDDLSGTIITSNKPITVISGNTCAHIGKLGSAHIGTLGFCDYLTAFLLPVNNWGKEFVVAPTRNVSRNRGDIFRVFAYENDTTVHSAHNEDILLSSGEFVEFDPNKDLASVINCSRPCQVVQYGKTSEKQRGPSMIVVPSVEQFLPQYSVITAKQLRYRGRRENFSITLMVHVSDKNSLRIDSGSSGNQFEWRRINGTEYVWTVFRLSGRKDVTMFSSSTNASFGLLVYGRFWKSDMRMSYGYPGGFSLKTSKNNISGLLPTSSTTPKTPESSPPTSSAAIKATKTTSSAKSSPPTPSATIKTTKTMPSAKSSPPTPSASTKTAKTMPPTKISGSPPTSSARTKTPETMPPMKISVSPPTSSARTNKPKTTHPTKSSLLTPTATIRATKTMPSAKSPSSKSKANTMPSCRDDRICRLSKITVNSTNVIEVSKEIANFSSKKLTADDVDSIASILENIVDLKRRDEKVADNVLNAVDNILDVPSDVLTKSQRKKSSSGRILQLLNNLFERLNVTENRPFKRTLKNFVLDVSVVNPRTFAGVSFPGNTSSTIDLPKTLFNETDNGNVSKSQTMIMTAYKETKLFSVNASSQKGHSLNSYVIACSIKARSVTNLTNPVVLKFTSLKDGEKNNASCVFWNFSQQGWSHEGCTFKGVQEDGRIVCHCNHLTNFAMLMDVSVHHETTHEKVLGLISYIGCVLSLVGLLLTIMTILLFRELRTNNAPTQILLNFCIALSFTLVVFLAAAERSRTSCMFACRAAAIALHYFVLATFMWMAIAAFNMYLAFVKVLNSYFPKFMLKCSVVAWGIPVLFVIITVAVALDDYGDAKYCRLHGTPFLVSFLAPILVILVGNTIAFVLIFRSLLKSGSKVTVDLKITGYQQARQGAAIFVLLGLTWLFGVLAISDAKVVFQYLFCIFNSLQGLCVFLLYCVLSPSTRERYRRLCGKKLSYHTAKKSVFKMKNEKGISSKKTTSENDANGGIELKSVNLTVNTLSTNTG